ncbi:MAG: aspartate carbamoyltransferase [Planctomycetes bacterium]|nr:aspartate carbamoyltransferase [Planctomycetota bacterium]
MTEYARRPAELATFEEFHNLPIERKINYWTRDGRPFHVVNSRQFTRGILEDLIDLTNKIRRIAKAKTGVEFLHSLLPHKRAMLFFKQPSTRTFLSFVSACDFLGISWAEVRDSGVSSEAKGETEDDSVRVFSSFFDVMIMRHPDSSSAERVAYIFDRIGRPIPVINGGAGPDEHPTQALLDVYTLDRSFERQGGIEGKKICFVGDCKRGRTVRSLARLLALYEGVELFFCAPKSLQVLPDVTDYLHTKNVKFTLLSELEPHLGEMDAFYMTRIQDEWDAKDRGNVNTPVDIGPYIFRERFLPMIKFGAIIMHPLPKRNEIEPAVDNDRRAMYWRQVRNGMWARSALLAYIFQRDDEIKRYFNKNT